MNLSKINTSDNLQKMVVHCKKEKYDIYIGRSSKWGNPFIIGQDGTREDVLKKYRIWILNNFTLMKDLPELKNKVLGCWCAPQKCHGDILIELLKEYYDKLK